jgi:hypothetical protein
MSIPEHIPEKSWCLLSLDLRPSKIHGMGVFTSAPIHRGDVVVVWGGHLFSGQELSEGKGQAHTIVQIGADQFLGSLATEDKTLDDYMNHACDPTVWLRDSVTLEARRDLEVDEELTGDYAIWLDKPNYRLRCNCGSPNCRKLITGIDWKLAPLQVAYRGHFAGFLNKKILERLL